MSTPAEVVVYAATSAGVCAAVAAADAGADVVALGSYHLDVREVQRTWRWVPEHPRPVAMVFTEG